jgi:Carboxypeptidase regulatory-like domain
MLSAYNAKCLGKPIQKILVVLVVVLLGVLSAVAQTTISTGSIQGTVTDPSGAVLTGAKVSITNKATGQTISAITNAAGAYTSGALSPAEYEVRFEMKGFHTTVENVQVQVNTTSSANAKLGLGESTQVVEVQAAEVAVNTEQATVQGVLTSQQIETLPINGRNFLDLAQLEPGVQIQDGGTFDPTKNGFSSISFGGRFGRTARIEVDGIDISDENVGTTTQNIPLGAIQEAALQQSSLDLSTELTSSGSVNISTKSGTNGLHGEGFYYFRDQKLDAALPGGSANPFQRNQYGGSLSGPILKDKLFFFVDAERTKQDFINPVLPSAPFSALTGNFNSPFRDPQWVGRLDYNGGPFKFFYRFSYESNKSTLPFIPNSFQPFANTNHSRDHVIGVDFNTGSFTHSIRFGYIKFENGIKDAVTGSSIFDPAPGIELAIGADVRCLTPGANQFCSGVNFLAPQTTIQSNHQIKYDGSKVLGKHIFRFGGGFNHIQGGGFAKFLGLAPAVGAPLAACAANPGVCTNAADPLKYPVENVILGNGQGFATENGAFGLPAGGLGPDNRLSGYFGDSWKFRPNLTITAGLRYARDTGRTDSDLAGIPALNAFNNQFYSGLGNPVRQPNSNVAPQVGFAWDPRSNGKTVIRGGIGLFYENAIWNNVLFDRPGRLQQGLFLGTTNACQNGTPQNLPFATSINLAAICGHAIGDVFSQIVTLQQQYQAAVLAQGPSQNGGFVGNLLADGANITGTNLFFPNYRTPRSVQMNIGVQRELRPGMVLTVDYLRNISTHTLLSGDTNHVGDSRFFNAGNAQAAIARTLTACQVGTIDQAIAGCPGLHPGQNGGPAGPATIGDFSGMGLDSGYSLCSGLPCALASPFKAAFPGINQDLGANQMLLPIGRSVYNGLQTSLRENLRTPFRGVKYLNLQVSYSYSKYVSTARDSDFINYSADNRNPTAYMGPNALDRTHQLSFGGTADLPGGFRVTTIGHFYSPLALNLNLPGGGLFVSDVTGDGTGDGGAASNAGLGDLLPGTKYGAFGRDVSVGKLRSMIANYNGNAAGQPTPAGQVLISNNLFSLGQLQQLGGVQQPLNPVPAGAVGQGWLKAFDFGLSWGYRVKDRFEIRPGVTFFNVFNLPNFDGVSAPFSTTLDPLGTATPGAPNSTTNPQPSALRLGLGSGVFGQGSPRVIEFELKASF